MDDSLQVDLKLENGVSKVALTGAITENSRLSELPAKLSKSVELTMENVERINSAGVREWVTFMRALRANGTDCVLERCPPAVMTQFAMIMDFGCGARVRSVLAPFTCEACFTEHLELMPADAALAGRLEQPLPCPKCGQQMQFDDLPEHFLAFQAPR